MNRWGFPDLGAGIGLDGTLMPDALAHAAELDLLEVISEDFLPARSERRLALELMSQTHPIVLHGTCLSLGAEEELDFGYLEELEALADRICAPWISDHLCWSGARERHLFAQDPLDYSERTLARLVERVQRVQDFLERPLVLENPGSFAPAPRRGMDEAEFLVRLAEGADCPLLIDLESLCRNALHQDFDPVAYLGVLPRERVVEVHLGLPEELRRPSVQASELIVREGAWELFPRLVRQVGPVTTIVECHEPVLELAALVRGAGRAADLLARAREHELARR